MSIFRRRMAGLLVALVGLLQFVNVPALGDVHEAGKLLLLAMVLLLVTGFWLWRLPEVSCPRPLLLFGGLWVILLIGSLQAKDPFTALLGLGVFGLLLLFALFQVNVCRPRHEYAPLLLDAVLVCGVVAAVLGLYQYCHFQTLGPSRGMLIPYLLPPHSDQRVTGMFGQANHSALLMLLAMLAFAYNYLHRPIAKVGLARISSLHLVPFILLALVFFLSWSRTSILALGALVLLLVWVYGRGYLAPSNGRPRQDALKLLACLATAFLLFKFFGNIEWSGEVRSAPAITTVKSFHFADTNVDSRWVFWTAAILMFLDHPLFGVGLQQFGAHLSDYLLQAHEILGFVTYEALLQTDWVHNEWLQILCEGGAIAFGLTCLLLFMYSRSLVVQVFRNTQPGDPLATYLHIILLPFLIHALFCWPLRYPPMLVLFAAFVGLLCSENRCKAVPIRGHWRSVALTGIFACIVTTLAFGRQEVRIGQFKAAILRGDDLMELLPQFEALANHPYSRKAILRNALPRYVSSVASSNDAEQAQQILPYAEMATRLQGAYSDWYNLALICKAAGAFGQARTAIDKAIALQPDFQPSWQFQHYLNILVAAEKTGRPVESFIPKAVNVNAVLQGFYNERNRPRRSP